jgi:glycerol-3-phosphate acyltransferase PlsY
MKAAFLILSYLIGSVPFGYIVFRLGGDGGKDIRRFGSRSTGATNVLRLKGWKSAVPVAVMDVLKAVVPVWLALRIFHDRRMAMAAAFMVVLGHCYPVFIRFRGGKGVSTAMGAFSVLSPFHFLLSLVVFVGVIAATRFVSLGSLAAVLSFSLFTFTLRGDRDLGALGLALLILIAVRHAANIGRLIRGRERKLGQQERVERG